jgi:hypothetical protein
MPWTNVRVLVADYNARTNWTRRPPGLDSANAHVVQRPGPCANTKEMPKR